MIQIRAHRTDDGIYVFDSQAQPKGAQHVYWWSLRANEMCAFTLDASFFSGMYLVRNKEALFQAAEKYRLWSQKYLDAFTAEWTAYWSSRNRPPPVSRASAYYAETDGWDYSDSSEKNDKMDMATQAKKGGTMTTLKSHISLSRTSRNQRGVTM